MNIGCIYYVFKLEIIYLKKKYVDLHKKSKENKK